MPQYNVIVKQLLHLKVDEKHIVKEEFQIKNFIYSTTNTDLRNDLRKITIPTVIMHGKKDKICSFDLAKQLKIGILDSHIVAFENSGHSLFLEETPKFNAELIKFAAE